VHELNERCLAALTGFAKGLGPCDIPAIAQCRALWSQLDALSIQRAAQLPFVILNVRFTDGPWWRTVTDPVLHSRIAPATAGAWPGDLAEPLLQELLIFAWHTVKWDARVARLLLGMSPQVAESLAGLSPQRLTELGQEAAGELRLRRQEDHEFWGSLVTAALKNSRQALSDVHLHAKLLLCGELLAASG
jgi:hypothetical protein